jgi:hypothetical protein
MILSRLGQHLTSSHLYPDHVVIIYRYVIPPCTSQTFASALGTLGFRRDPRHHGMRGTFNLGENPVPATLVARRAGPTVGFTVHINVLSLLHRSETRDFGEERGLADNWLHPEAVEDSEPVWQLLYQQIIEHEMYIADLANEVAERIVTGGTAGIQHIRVNRIELCADFGTQNPHAVMRMLAPRFKERFNRVRFQRYGELRSASWSGELYHDCNYIRGFLSAGVSFKLYEKTDRRVRLEVEYTRDGLTRRGAPISLTDDMDGQEIAPLRNFLIEQCLPQMNGMLARAQSTEDHCSVYHLVSRVAPIFTRSEPAELERILRALTLHRRITSQTLPYRKLAQLRDAGVLVSTNRGVYGIAPEYIVAFRVLRFTDTISQRNIARAAAAAEATDLEWPEAAE